ncbi:hypothetical protein MNBD_GAMMA09-1304 [hydrothermal vent metagenome]|uniref:Polyketide cyclase/dehydrase n=1 Tax=hydrothermal vent metagenome TaxID=652676 RepID=A0A3B0XHR0_9ZZZZ
MTKVSVSKEYNIAPAKLWQKVRQFNDMHKFLPSMITSCEVQGSGEGAKRICGTENGDILETLRSLDDVNMILQYSIDNEDAPMPVSNYTGKASVRKLGDSKAEFTWSAIFDAKGMPETEVVKMLEEAFNGLLNNIVEEAR